MSIQNAIAQVVDGKALSRKVQEDLSRRVEKLTQEGFVSPGLAVVLVGDNPASKVYVRSKTKNAEKCGMRVIDVHLPADISDDELQSQLLRLSEDPAVDGILLQLPLPKGLDEFKALLCIAPEKDVDGLHPVNQGLLMRGAAEGHLPCTPSGAMLLVDQALLQLGLPHDISGKHAVVVGRSILVGKPVALMLLARNCTVEMAHSRTRDLQTVCRRADILVAAVGKPRFLGPESIKPGAIVIDVGINHDTDGKLCGDVDYEPSLAVSGAITPVPGGVGPMTIAMLLANTVTAAERRSVKK